MSGGRRSKLETPPKTITCWRCRRKIGLDAARRSCPLCGAEPSVARYDERAHEVGSETSLLRAHAQALHEGGATPDALERADGEADGIANRLVAQYGDPDGSKARRHLEEINLSRPLRATGQRYAG